MSPLVLLGLWWLTQNKGGAQPTWPSPASPPPPRPPAPAPAPSQRPPGGRPRRPPARRPKQQRSAPAQPAPSTPSSPLPADAPIPPEHIPSPPSPPAPIDAPASQPTASRVQILTAQRMLNALGAKLVTDGLFGPRTREAWGRAAKARQYDPTFQRLDPQTAAVHTQTFAGLKAAAEGKRR